MPSSTAANIVFDRRKASINSRMWSGVVISDGLQSLAAVSHRAWFSLGDGADPDSRRQYLRRRGVQQLVVFAVVQRLIERRAFEQRHVPQFRGNSRCFAEAVK